MASQSALEFARRNGKCKSGKGTLTKALNKFSELCNDVTKMEPNIPELSRVRKANLLTEQVDKVRKAMAGLEVSAQELVETVWTLPPGSRTTDQNGVEMTEDQMYTSISTTIQECVDKQIKFSRMERHQYKWQRES